MVGLLLRLALLTAGLALTEIALTGVFTSGAPADWLRLGGGLLLVIAGTYGFLTPLLSGRQHERTRR